MPLATGHPAAGVDRVTCDSGRRRPNIVWLTSEDNGPHLGSYGDPVAATPSLDDLARRGLIFLNAWSTAPVCAPARTALISGLYPTSTGSEHMRSLTRLPEGFEMFPAYLRAAGYYCTNNAKEDYNLVKPGQVWDESGPEAHWRNRAPNQPFFAVFNFSETHESQIRSSPHRAVHELAEVHVPAYHPDTLEVRLDWAQYHDKISEMDAAVGAALAELELAGLAADTIVFYFSDHGSGMPRSKRWPYNSGLQVPLIVSVPPRFLHLAPEDYRPGGRSDRLVGFVDLAPTVLSLAGVSPPAYLQGRAFMGEFSRPGPEYAFGFRGRMDERYDLVRVVRDRRYLYVRNYMPHKIYGQYIAYMFETPTTRIWRQMFSDGRLDEVQSRFWQVKPVEELYDLDRDHDEVVNLAASPAHAQVLQRLRAALRQWILEVHDVGFLPEHEIHQRAEGSTPWEVGRDRSRYPLEAVLATAELASSLVPDAVEDLVAATQHPDSAVRYWGVMGLLMRGSEAVRSQAPILRNTLGDPSPAVRVAAAEALARHGEEEDLAAAAALLRDHADPSRFGQYIGLQALNAIDELADRSGATLTWIRQLPRQGLYYDRRMEGYISGLAAKIEDGLAESAQTER